MYKAISILRELFFPQWIEELKQNDVIDPTPTPPPSTPLLTTTSTPSITGSTTTALRDFISSTSPGNHESTTPGSNDEPSSPFRSWNGSLFEDPSRVAEGIAELVGNLTFLPVYPPGILRTWEELQQDCPNGTCSANETVIEWPSERNYWALILLVFPVLTIFGNTLVILSVFRERSLQTATNYFIVSLACADLLVASVVMPFAVYIEVNLNRWDLGDSICDTWIAADVIASTCSIFNLTAISIDRFIAVTQPLKYARHKNHSRVVYTILIVWLVSCCIGMPIILGLNVPVHGVRLSTSCIFYNSDFTIYSSLSSFYIPCILMVYLYYKIFRAIRLRAAKSSHNQRRDAPPPPAQQGSGGAKAIPMVESQWTKNALSSVQIRAGPHASGISRLKPKNHQNNDGGTISASLLLDSDEVAEDVDVESGSGSTPPMPTTVTQTDTADGKNRRGSTSLESSTRETGLVSTPVASALQTKRAQFMASLRMDSREEKTLQNGNVAAENAHNKRFNKQKNHRRSIKSREKVLAQRERKATKTLAIVLGVFLACWVPFFTASMMNAICNKLQLKGCPDSNDAFMVTTWLGYGNSFMNPVIYTVFNEEFRKSFLNILRCKKT